MVAKFNSNMPNPELKARIAKLLGAKPTSYTPVQGGYTPAARWRVGTEHKHFFAKIATTSSTAENLRREFHTYNNVSGSFMPELIGWEDDETAPILIIEDLSDSYWPPPWTRQQIDMVLEQIDEIHCVKALVPTFDEVHAYWNGNWQTVADNPKPFLSLNHVSETWLQQALPILIEAAKQCQTSGIYLTHFDIRSDNICITPSHVKLIDWGIACLSNPRLDLGFWLPSLTFEGGPNPEEILPDAPSVAAWVAGFFASRAGLPNIKDAPRVRLVQQQQLTTALPWAIRALRLSD
jgi:thiamine kinase-like enzyme